MAEKVKLKRVRKLPYKVNYPTDSGVRSYAWAGAQGKRFDTKEVPVEVFDWLSFNTSTFRNGELVVVEDSEEAKELVETLSDVEEYRANTREPEDIEKILRGNIMKMKKELNEITSKSEKRNVLEIAKELKDELPNGKLKAIAEWAEVKQDILFGDE